MLVMDRTQYTVTISCPDQSGIISAVTGCIASAGGNIVNLAQHTAVDIEHFFCRITFVGKETYTREKFTDAFNAAAGKFGMEWHLYSSDKKPRVAVLVSKTNHCLYEMLLKHQDGELSCEIPVIISNHSDLCAVATQFHIPFFQVDPGKGKAAYEADLQELLEQYGTELVVLARYMQVLSPEFTEKWENRIINIHHGFLPAFKGAKPYHQAWNKGVKMIGATGHFANEDLDQGPIIYQDVIRVEDTCSVSEFIRRGKDVERRVLVEAVKRYLNHNIFLFGGRTFIIE